MNTNEILRKLRVFLDKAEKIATILKLGLLPCYLWYVQRVF